MELRYSFIVPVYNRPEELDELLQTLAALDWSGDFEVVIVEDGSSLPADGVIRAYRDKLQIQYLPKSNTGPGLSRNYGMRHARGNYFIILDSDCLLPEHYLKAADKALQSRFTDFYGGPDTAHESFTITQKAINQAMTSVLSTGGIRGRKGRDTQYEPRSFNMGLSREAFEHSGGFGNIHPGEDPDLSIRLRKSGMKAQFIEDAYVFHKRRVDLRKFFLQMKKFGLVRPILNHWHPGTAKLTYWFPSIFIIGLLLALLLPVIIPSPQAYWGLGLYLAYFIAFAASSLAQNHDLPVALLSPFAVFIQFTAYGYGFLKSTILVTFSGKKPEELFPGLFYMENHSRTP